MFRKRLRGGAVAREEGVVTGAAAAGATGALGDDGTSPSQGAIRATTTQDISTPMTARSILVSHTYVHTSTYMLQTIALDLSSTRLAPS